MLGFRGKTNTSRTRDSEPRIRDAAAVGNLPFIALFLDFIILRTL
jgi:hypothetical protein